MDRFILILIVIAAFFSVLTFILHIMFKKIPIVKYLPAIMCLPAAIYNMVIAKTGTEGFQDIGSALLAIMFFAGLIAGAATGVILDYRQRRL